MAISICMLNQKGGVGKTSLCHHLSGALALSGQRVLLVDLDFQCNLTQSFLGWDTGRLFPEAASAAVLFNPSAKVSLLELIRPTEYENISILPGCTEMKSYGYEDPAKAGLKQLAVKRFLSQVANSFDIVFLDCHPDVALPTWAAVAAANFVVIPVQPEDYGIQGVPLMLEVIAGMQAGLNPKLKLLGYVITKRESNAYHRQFEAVLRKTYGDAVFEHVMPKSVQYAKAITARKPIAHWECVEKKWETAIASIAEELLNRVKRETTPLVIREAI
jgi:chromosome partitioning protein